MNKWFTFFLNSIFPTRCIVCEKQGPDLCQKCLHGFEKAKPSHHEWIHSFWNYRDPNVEKMMRYLKNYPNERLIKIIIAYLSPLPVESIHIIIPVPIHKKRFIKRGYNQAELLAKYFARSLQIPLVTNGVYKKFATHKQGTLKSKTSRLHNLENSFGVKNNHLIKNKNILIIDDITTSGATLCEIQKTLLAAGAQSVSALTIAN